MLMSAATTARPWSTKVKSSIRLRTAYWIPPAMAELDDLLLKCSCSTRALYLAAKIRFAVPNRVVMATLRAQSHQHDMGASVDGEYPWFF